MAKYEHFKHLKKALEEMQFISTVQCFHFFSPIAPLLEHFQPWLASSGSHFNSLRSDETDPAVMGSNILTNTHTQANRFALSGETLPAIQLNSC